MIPTNQVILVGNLGKDVELDYLPNGTTKGRFSLAVTERWTKDGERKEKTVWIPVEAFGKVIEIAVDNGLAKGRGAVVHGRYAVDNYEGKDGKPRSKTYVLANNIGLLQAREKPEE